MTNTKFSTASPRFSRRSFIQRAAIVSAASALPFPYIGRVLGANDRINVACIGVGGKGSSDTNEAIRHGHLVALCDVDSNTLNKKAADLQDQFPQAKKYSDFRKLLDEVGKDIDAVTISTPDHVHGVPAIRAMQMGKHCFCQKPLTQNVQEARVMRQLAKEKKLATQMGNQGSAAPGLRRAVEIIEAGVIGAPKELHVWSNRPVWPQGLDRPEGEDPVPENLDWDLWLGPATRRPYKKGVYHTFNWRGWYDFGTGALGDMACHTVNMPFRALKLGYPDVVECELASRIYTETFPKTTRIRFEFPEREGLPPLKFWWYDGNPGDPISPLRPTGDTMRGILEWAEKEKLINPRASGKFPTSGALIIGEKGRVFSPDDYGSNFYISLDGQPFTKGQDHEAAKPVPQTIPRSPGHMEEWFKMMRDGTPAYANFDISAYLTEIILLGAIALRVGEGRKVEWDGPGMKSKNIPEAAQFVSRQNRAGWELA